MPVIAVSGDETTAIEARELLGKVECAVVKAGVGRNTAERLTVDDAHERIRQAIIATVKKHRRLLALEANTASDTAAHCLSFGYG